MNHNPMLGWHEQHYHSVTNAITCHRAGGRAPWPNLGTATARMCYPWKEMGNLKLSEHPFPKAGKGCNTSMLLILQISLSVSCSAWLQVTFPTQSMSHFPIQERFSYHSLIWSTVGEESREVIFLLLLCFQEKAELFGAQVMNIWFSLQWKSDVCCWPGWKSVP